MASKPRFDEVDVAVTIIFHGDRILIGYNRKWSSFSLPMTKRRTWHHPGVPDEVVREEEWVDAAARAAAEWLGCTSTSPPKFLKEYSEFRQGDRDGVWKKYRLYVFGMQLDDAAAVPGTAVAEWLTFEEILDSNRRPISPTARYVIGQVKADSILPDGGAP